MTESGTLTLPFKSLSRSLTRRVLLLSLIGVVGLCGTIALVFLLTILQVQEHMDQTNVEAVSAFDGFLQIIQSNLLAAGDGLAARDDVNSALLQIQVRNPPFLDVLYVGLDGTVLAQRNAFGRPKRTAIEQPAWLKSPPPYGEVRVGPVGFEGQLPYIDMAVTATDDIGLPAGLLVARVDLTRLWDTTLQIKVGKTGYAYIADSSGQLVVSRNRRLLETGSNLEQLIGRTPQAIAASRPSFYTGLSGQPVVAAAQPLRTVPWFAVVEQPVGEALAPFVIPALSLLAVLVVVVVLLYNTVRFTRVRIVSPLLALRDIVGRMAEGQLEQRVEVGRNDELGQLAGSFNSMAAQLQQAFAALEDRIAVLHQAQDALRATTARLETLIQVSPLAITLLDLAGNIQLWNPSAERIFGWTAEEAIGHANPIVPAAGQAEYAAWSEQILHDQPLVNQEAVRQRKDGSLVDVSISSAPVYDAMGNLAGRMAIVADITNRKKAESQKEAAIEKLREAQQMYESVFRLSPGIIVVSAEADARYIDVNDAHELITGYRRDETIGHTSLELEVWDSPADRERLLQLVHEQGVVRNAEVRFRRKSGEPFTALHSLALVEVGGERCLISVITDITERKQAEEAALRHARQLAALNKAGQTIVSTLDLDTVLKQLIAQIRPLFEAEAALVLLVDPAKGELVLAAADSPSSGSLPGLRVPLDAGIAGWVAREKQALLLNDAPSDPRFYKHVDATIGMTTHSLLAVPLIYENRVIGVIEALNKAGPGFDASDLEMLEALASPAAVAIENARLYAGQAEALRQEQAMRTQLVQAGKLSAMGRMVASVAHELNNPLQTIKNCLFLIQPEAGPEQESSRYLAMATSEVERLANLVTQLRAVYRPTPAEEAGPVNLPDVIEEVRLLLAPHLAENSSRWECASPPAALTVNGLPDQLKQVFLNISLNAVDAMRPAGGTLAITWSLAADGRQVGVVFKDTGHGIAADELPNLFDPFYTTKETGMGLGLAICYDIVQRHGGRIEVESQPGQGATFTVWLPLARPT